MANFIAGIISLTVGAVIMANVFINTIKDQDTTGNFCFLPNGTVYSCSWSTSEIAMWGLLSLIGIVGLVFGVLNVFGLV